jgi:chloramphenicol 3-O phosphotransferase
MMPERYLERPLWDDVLGQADHAGAYGHSLVHGMHQAIQALSRAGINILADHVLVEEAWARECAKLFAELPAYTVGVTCPLEELERRESARKNRTLGQARLQFPLIHKYVTYDIEVNSLISMPDKCAQLIIQRMQNPPIALQKMKSEMI